MTAPPRSLGALGLSKLGIFIRLAAIVVLSLLYTALPGMFSSVQPHSRPGDEILWVTLFFALVIFGVTFFATRMDPQVGKTVNKVLTVVLAIPVIGVLLLVVVALIYSLSRM